MAISRDAVVRGGYSASGGITYAHTISAGSGRVLYVFCFGANTGADTVTGITYAGVSMTRLAASLTPTDNRYTYLYRLFDPATGSNNVVISVSGGDVYAQSGSYTGRVGSTEVVNSGTQSSASSFGLSVTVPYSDNWLVGGFRGNPFSAMTAGSGTSLWDYDSTFDMAFVDSNGVVGTGSQSLNVNGGATLNWSAEISTIPLIPSTIQNHSNLLLMGAG